MTTSIGSSLQSRSSKPTDLSLQKGLGVCVFFGVAAALIDLYLHIPFQHPGWRGLPVMMCLVFARLLSGREWGASAAAFTASVTAIAVAGSPHFGTLAFLVPGLVVDGVCILAGRFEKNPLVVALAAGLGNVAKFAVAFISISAFSAHAGAMHGMLMPWISHFGFGLCGGLIAFLLASPFAPGRTPPKAD